MDKIKPRGKGIVGHTLGLRDSFKAFNKDQSPESLFFIDYKTYRSVCEKFNKKVVEDIL